MTAAAASGFATEIRLTNLPLPASIATGTGPAPRSSGKTGWRPGPRQWRSRSQFATPSTTTRAIRTSPTIPDCLRRPSAATIGPVRRMEGDDGGKGSDAETIRRLLVRRPATANDGVGSACPPAFQPGLWLEVHARRSATGRAHEL